MYLSLISSEQYMTRFATLDVCLQVLRKTKGTKQGIKPPMQFEIYLFFSDCGFMIVCSSS